MKILRKWGWLGLVLVFGGMLAALYTPLPRVTQDIKIEGPQDGPVQSLDAHISYPSSLYLGDAGLFQMKIGLSGTDLKAVLLSARLEIPGVDGKQALISEPLRPGEQGNFSWEIDGNGAGPARGTLWITLNPTPDTKGTAAEDVLLAKPILIHMLAFGGLSALTWRVIGWAGMAAGLLWGGWVWLHRDR